MNSLKTDTGKYLPEIIERSVRLYEKGMKAETVEKITGMKRRSVNYHARRLGIKRKAGNTSFTPKQATEIKQLYVKGSLSSNQVADIMNVSARKVRKFLAREGLTRDRLKALRMRFERRTRVKNNNKRFYEHA